MKRKISNAHFKLLEKEFHYLERTQHLKPGQANNLLSVYKPSGKFSFIRTLLVIGSLLIGIGVLSFIAGNWEHMSKTVKFSLLFFAVIGFYSTGYKLDASFPKTARSFYYIGIFVFGAGIFLIGQMFNLGGDVYAAFLAWGVGILPLAYYLKDKYIATASALFFCIYGFTVFDTAATIPYILLVLIPFLFWMNQSRMNGSRLLFASSILLALTFILNVLIYFDFDELIIFFVFFALGLGLALSPVSSYKVVSEWIGAIVYGTSGLFLTFPGTWESLLSTNSQGPAAVIFSILFGALLIFLLKKDSLQAILIVCVLIFRLYTDLSYDFMPKSLFFVVGGFILIGFGFWFEKSRRDTLKAGEHNEK